MPNWKSPEAFQRLLAAMVAAQDMKVCDHLSIPFRVPKSIDEYAIPVNTQHLKTASMEILSQSEQTVADSLHILLRRRPPSSDIPTFQLAIALGADIC